MLEADAREMAVLGERGSGFPSSILWRMGRTSGSTHQGTMYNL